MSDNQEEKLKKLYNVSVMIGPDDARGLFQASEGDVFVSSKTAYRYERESWHDLEVDTDWLVDTLRAYRRPNDV